MRISRPAASSKAGTSRAFKGNRSLAASHLNRSGLSRGTIAPSFKLPLLTGGEITLESYRGRRLLLVFSDPHCPPCRELMPGLDALHKRTPDIEVMVISRGNIEDVRAEFSSRPVSFPVAMQKRWEISRRYAMFATPIAYLIDESGLTASDVVTGSVPIQVLLASAQIFMLMKSVKKLQTSFRKLAQPSAPREGKRNLSTKVSRSGLKKNSP
jgi:peroxiredoxin